MANLLEFLRTHEEAFRSRARLSSLYADFAAQRSTNPDGYAANSAAWLHALTSACKAGLLPSQSAANSDRFVLHSGPELARAFDTDDYGQPLALGAVVQDATQQKKLVLLKDFFEAKQSVYSRSWLPTPLQALKWGLAVLGIGGDERGKLVQGEFVVMENVEAAAKAVIKDADKIATSNTSRVFSKQLFLSTFSSPLGIDAMSETDLRVLIVHLSRDRNAISHDPATSTIKFRASSATHPESVTSEDISIASLRTLIAALEPQISNLQKHIATLETTARTAVTNKQLTSAKSALRSKKLAEGTLEKRTATLHQLEEVYTKIEQAADNVEVVRVMEASSKTLASLNKQTGGVERVQDVVDGLREQMADTDEMQKALTEASAGGIDEGEVDEELEAMEKVESEKEEAAKRKLEEEKTEREAEETRKRLAELDQADGEKKAEEKNAEEKNAEEKKAEEKPAEASVETEANRAEQEVAS